MRATRRSTVPAFGIPGSATAPAAAGGLVIAGDLPAAVAVLFSSLFPPWRASPSVAPRLLRRRRA